MSSAALILALALPGDVLSSDASLEAWPPTSVASAAYYHQADVNAQAFYSRPDYLAEPIYTVSETNGVIQGSPLPQDFSGEAYPPLVEPGTSEYFAPAPGGAAEAYGTPQPLWDPTGQAPGAYDPFSGPPPDAVIAGPAYGCGCDGCGCSPCGCGGGPPFPLGCHQYYALEYLPTSSLENIAGNFEGVGIDAGFSNAWQFGPSDWFRLTTQLGYRNWDFGGPIPSDDLFSIGFKYEMVIDNIGGSPFEFRGMFNPRLATDFDGTVGENTMQYDGSAMLFYQFSPRFKYGVGLGYWDRVQDRLMPFFGAIYKPDARWTFKIMYPESQISYFLGHGTFGGATWLYGRAEYHVEAYDVNSPLGGRDQIEMEDFRLALGIRKQYDRTSVFAEIGYVFDRTVRFERATLANTRIEDGLMLRLGLAF